MEVRHVSRNRCPFRTAVFDRIAKRIESWMGQPRAFGAAACICVLWALTDPLFDLSNAWQLVINTATTVVTFLMVFSSKAPRIGPAPRSN